MDQQRTRAEFWERGLLPLPPIVQSNAVSLAKFYLAFIYVAAGCE
jgi:hypothetical protein